MKLYTVWSFLSSSKLCLWDSSVSLHTLHFIYLHCCIVLHSVNISLPLMNICFWFWPMTMPVDKHVHTSLLPIYLELNWCIKENTFYKFVAKYQTISQSGSSLVSPPAVYESSWIFMFLATLGIFSLFLYNHSGAFVVALICIFLIHNEVQHLFMYLWKYILFFFDIWSKCVLSIWSSFLTIFLLNLPLIFFLIFCSKYFLTMS